MEGLIFGILRYIDKIPGTASINELKNITNSSHPEKGSLNQLNFLSPKDHGLAPVLQRLNNQVKDYKQDNNNDNNNNNDDDDDDDDDHANDSS